MFPGCYQISFLIQQKWYPVYALTGVEALSLPFSFELEIVLPQSVNSHNFQNKTAQLVFTGGQDRSKNYYGYVEKIRDCGAYNDNQRRIVCYFVSQLSQANSLITPGRLTSENFKTRLAKFCQSLGMFKIKWHERQTLKNFSNLWQCYEENNLQGLQRLLARQGYFFWEEADVLHIGNYLPLLAECPLMFITDAKNCSYPKNQPGYGLFALSEHREFLPADYEIDDIDLNDPSTLINAATTKNSNSRIHKLFGSGIKNLDEAHQTIQAKKNFAKAKSLYYCLNTHLPLLKLSDEISLILPGHNEKNAFYLTKIQHCLKWHEPAKQTCDNTLPYHSKIVLIPKTVDFFPCPLVSPQVRNFSRGYISGDREAINVKLQSPIDDRGQYQVRHAWDTTYDKIGVQPEKLTVITPYADPLTNEGASGQHQRLLFGSPVLLGYLYHHYERPMILGALPDAKFRDVVKHDNAEWHTMKTSGGNLLRIDESMEQQKLLLANDERQNFLAMHSYEKNFPFVLHSQGDINITGEQSLSFKIGGDHLINNQKNEERTQTVHKQVVQSNYQIKTENFLFESAKDFQLIVGENILHESGGSMKWNVRHGAQLTAANKNLDVEAGNEMHLNVHGDLCFNQHGNMNVILQSGASKFTIDNNNVVQFSGAAMALMAKTMIKIEGQVS